MNLQDALAVQKTPEHLKARARRGEKVYLGHETRPGWKGELPFYLFECSRCRMLVKDYPHGFPERQYLSCSECGQRIDFVEFRVRLKEFFATISLAFRLKLSKKLRQ